MSLLSLILLAGLAGGLLSVILASFAMLVSTRWIPAMVSYAIGALLGAAFLEVLPHAIEAAESPERAAMNILAGILIFFVLEKLVLWRHCHDEGCHGHGHDHAGHAHAPAQGHDHGRSGLLILIGDTFHNFVDGVLIAAAFVESTPLGIVTAMAIIAHEIPQEAGDFLILLHSGYSRGKALAFNLLSSLATLVGGILAYFALSHMETLVPVFLALAAASMIYVAVADLIPGLHKRTELRATAQQVLLIAAGIASIVLAHPLAERALG